MNPLPICLPLVNPAGTRNVTERALLPHALNSRKVLLIDPEDDLREVIQTGLELTTTWQVLTAHSYAVGANLAKVEQPNVILLNVEMVNLDRAVIFEQLKTNPATQKIPVILLTDRVRLADRQQFTQLGVAGVIAKPFDCAYLGRQIALFLNWVS